MTWNPDANHKANGSAVALWKSMMRLVQEMEALKHIVGLLTANHRCKHAVQFFNQQLLLREKELLRGDSREVGRRATNQAVAEWSI
jgi:hypothetical protein